MRNAISNDWMRVSSSSSSFHSSWWRRLIGLDHIKLVTLLFARQARVDEYSIGSF